MKISKSVLKAIAVGISVSTLAPSCEKIVDNFEDTKEVIKEKCNIEQDKSKENTPVPAPYDCPACGMG